MVIYFLVLQLLHLPLPCPDLDGECRGTPIGNIADANAWHPLLLGVRPNDDIDRGPIRGDCDQQVPTDSLFGDIGLSVIAPSVSSMQLLNEFAVARESCRLGPAPPFSTLAMLYNSFAKIDSVTLDSRQFRTSACVWLI